MYRPARRCHSRLSMNYLVGGLDALTCKCHPHLQLLRRASRHPNFNAATRCQFVGLFWPDSPESGSTLGRTLTSIPVLDDAIATATFDPWVIF